MDCFIHNCKLKGLENQTHLNLIPVNEGTWTRIVECAKYRKQLKNYNESSYKNIIESLPNEKSGLMYHLPCYKAFTSISKSQIGKTQPSPSNNNEKMRTRKSNLSIKPDKRGVLPKKCIICHTVRKKHNQKEQKLHKVMTDNAEIRWKKAINMSGNGYLMALLGQKESDHPAQEVHYHDCCKENFIRKHLEKDKIQTYPNTQNSPTNKAPSNRFLDSICSLIQDQVIMKGIPVSLTDLYNAYLTDLNGNDGEKLCRRTLLSKIQQHFERSIAIMNPLHKVGFIIYESTLSPEEAMRRFIYSDRSNSLSTCEALDMRKVVLKEAACIISNEINEIKRKVDPLPLALTKDHFKNGMCPNPPLTSSFNLDVIASNPLNPTEKELRIANSITSDMVYNATKGYIKPAKHLQVGVGVKSITGSEKVGRILHGLGHSISTTQEKEIITEIGHSILERGHAVPDGIHREPGLATTIDFDNYDELVDSIYSEHEATHDVQGIVTQNRKPNFPSHEILSEYGSPGSSTSKKRRRKIDNVTQEIEPYKKKPKVEQFKFKDYTGKAPDSIIKAERLDKLWLFASNINKSLTPMWRGWNSQFIKDPLPIQEISYLPNINAPITRLDVVNKTLAIAEQVRKECGEDYMRTGYDLQAAKLAYRIQDRETELYKRLFIDVGAMHFLMAFFGGVGYIITGSGLLEVLVESEVLGSGSVKGFTKGTYYSRCERLHPCLYMSCSNLHIKEFLKEQYSISISLRNWPKMSKKKP